MGWFMDQIRRFICFTNREPILKIRRIVWMVTVGWWLAIAYIFAAVAYCCLLVFLPFGIKAIFFCTFAFDPVTKEAYKEGNLDGSFSNPAKGAYYYYRMAANIVWLCTVGWGLVVFHFFAAVFSALTIIGIGTAITQVQLMRFAIWPFGQSLRDTYLPTSLEDYKRHEGAMQEMARRADIQKGRPQYGTDI